MKSDDAYLVEEARTAEPLNRRGSTQLSRYRSALKTKSKDEGDHGRLGRGGRGRGDRGGRSRGRGGVVAVAAALEKTNRKEKAWEEDGVVTTPPAKRLMRSTSRLAADDEPSTGQTAVAPSPNGSRSLFLSVLSRTLLKGRRG